MSKNFKLYYGLLSFILSLLTLLAIPTLASEKYPEKESDQVSRRSAQTPFLEDQDDDKEDYPNQPTVCILPFQASETNQHIEKVKNLKAAQLLFHAESLMKVSDTNAMVYLAKLIGDNSCLSNFRDRAVVKYLELGLNLLQINSQIEEVEATRLLKSMTKCAKLLSKKDSACPQDLVAAKAIFGMLHSPVCGMLIKYPPLRKHFNDPYIAAELIQRALEFPELELMLRKVGLNELGTLYLDGWFEKNEQAYRTAYKYYKQIGKDKSFSLQERGEAKLYQFRALQLLNMPIETFNKRRNLIAWAKSCSQIGPQLSKMLIVQDATHDIEEKAYTFNNNKCKELAILVISKLEGLLNDPELNPDMVPVRDLTYADAMITLIMYYGHPRAPFEKSLETVCKYINKKQTTPVASWEGAVLIMANVIYQTRNHYSQILRKREISDLLEEIIKRTDVSQEHLSEAKVLKLLLAARGLIKIPSKGKETILKEFIECLDDPMLPAYLKSNCYIVFSQEVQKLSSKYNEAVKEVVDRLKEIHIKEIEPSFRETIEFVLLQYYFAYEECEIQDEEAKQYVLNLLGKNTPLYLYVKEFIEKQITIEGAEEPASIIEEPLLKFNKKTEESEPPEDLSLPDISSQLTYLEKNREPVASSKLEEKIRDRRLPIPSQPKKPDNVVRYDPLKEGKEKGVKEERDLEKAELLLERLRSRRGKVSQSEVTNMLRRLDFTFEPTQDDGFTVHIGHKGKSNKKGTAGALKGGARASCANVVKDAISKTKGKYN